jgi:hypothetical protein
LSMLAVAATSYSMVFFMAVFTALKGGRARV